MLQAHVLLQFIEPRVGFAKSQTLWAAVDGAIINLCPEVDCVDVTFKVSLAAEVLSAGTPLATVAGLPASRFRNSVQRASRYDLRVKVYHGIFDKVIVGKSHVHRLSVEWSIYIAVEKIGVACSVEEEALNSHIREAGHAIG